MKVLKAKGIPYILTAYCEDCHEVMEASDTILTTYPARYMYVCPKCGKQEESTVRYPTIGYDYEDGECLIVSEEDEIDVKTS